MGERESSFEYFDERIRQFAQTLAQWDGRIVEITGVRGLSGNTENLGEKIHLICSFNPEPRSANSGFISVINLILRDDHEGMSEQLGIPNQIDLGFRLSGKVYLADGEILKELEEGVVLWAQRNHEQ